MRLSDLKRLDEGASPKNDARNSWHSPAYGGLRNNKTYMHHKDCVDALSVIADEISRNPHPDAETQARLLHHVNVLKSPRNPFEDK